MCGVQAARKALSDCSGFVAYNAGRTLSRPSSFMMRSGEPTSGPGLLAAQLRPWVAVYLEGRGAL